MTLTQRLLGLIRLRPAPPDTPAWHLSGTRWSEALNDEDMRHIGTVCPPRPYHRDERIYRIGEPSGTLYVLLEGQVKLSRPGRLNAEQVLSVCGPDDFFGESFLTPSATTLSNAVCLTERAIVCPINRAQFLEIVRLRPGVAVLLSGILATRLQELQARLNALDQPVQMRLAQVMLDLTYRFGHQVDQDVYALNVNLRHEEIASLARTSRVSATQVISAWRQQGIVVGTRGEYRVDTTALEGMTEQLQLECPSNCRRPWTPAVPRRPFRARGSALSPQPPSVPPRQLCQPQSSPPDREPARLTTA